MDTHKKYNAAFRVYDFIWKLVIPLLRFNSRLKDGFNDRCSVKNLNPADIWIQAASAGEAYLAWSLLENLSPDQPVNILVTTNTRQGLDILNKAVETVPPGKNHVSAQCAYIPFDRPAIMESAVEKINPKLMVLLETEIWPGLLHFLKKLNRKIIIINGRLTPKSLRRYLLWPDFWKALKPDKILAISEADADRFTRLFGSNNAATMNNIKFDRLVTVNEKKDNPLASLLPKNAQILTLGSVRQEEEDQIINIITDIQKNIPETVIGLFPRHMHRIDFWKETLRRLNIKWQLRSETNNKPVQNGSIILWDMFGELNLGYAISDAVFVGGSLAPLGGQNFLEPLAHGISPVIGPFWDNFTWVGKDIFTQGLVIKAADWQSVAAELVKQMQHNNSDKIFQKKAIRYIKNCKGGTTQACNLIKNMLHI